MRTSMERTEEPSLLEQAVAGRNTELFYFDALIEDESEFNLAMVTRPDDFILRLHEYLIRKESRENALHSEDAFDPMSARLQQMISRLENLSVVQEQMNAATQSAKPSTSTPRVVVERPKEKKRGVIRRTLHSILSQKSDTRQ